MAAVTFQVSLSLQGAYPDLGSDMSSALVAQASFCGETTGVVIRWWRLLCQGRHRIIIRPTSIRSSNWRVPRASDWLKLIWVVTSHQHRIYALVLRRHFTGKPMVVSQNVGSCLQCLLYSCRENEANLHTAPDEIFNRLKIWGFRCSIHAEPP